MLYMLEDLVYRYRGSTFLEFNSDNMTIFATTLAAQIIVYNAYFDKIRAEEVWDRTSLLVAFSRNLWRLPYKYMGIFTKKATSAITRPIQSFAASGQLNNCSNQRLELAADRPVTCFSDTAWSSVLISFCSILSFTGSRGSWSFSSFLNRCSVTAFASLQDS